MPNALAKLDDLKAALGFSGAAEDALLTQLLVDATSAAARLVGLPTLMRAVNIIEYPRPDLYGSPVVQLDRYPIESITSLKLAGYTTNSDGFALLNSLVADEDYSFGRDFGGVQLFRGEVFVPYPRANLVVYTAGYIDPADAAPPATALQSPADLQRAVIIEATRLYNTRRDAGVNKLDAGKKTVGHAPDRAAVSPVLEAACSALRRVSL